MTVRIPFNAVDEAFANFDNPVTPPTVQLELDFGERLDIDRLWDAVQAAMDRHPLAAARRAPWSGGDSGFEWIVDDVYDVEPLALRRCRPQDLPAIGAELQGTVIPIDTSPAMRFVLARTEESDHLLVAAHHAASDGMGTMRLLLSIARSYAGRPDPVPDLDPVQAHTITADTARDWGAAGAPDPTAEVDRLVRSATPPARVAASGGTDQPGYALVYRSIDVGSLVRAPIRAATAATVNDVLLAALHLGIARWNTERSRPTGLVTVQMPINARPADRSREVVANLVVVEHTTTTEAERSDRTTAVAAIAEQTRQAKERGPFAAVPSWNDAAIPTPIWWRQMVAAALPFATGHLSPTAVLSNLGRFDPADLSFGEDAPATGLRFSPPAGGQTGVNVGAVTLGDDLSLVFRHTHAQFDADAASAFADLVLAEIDELCRS